MKFNKWTIGLAAVGAVSLASAVRADEAKMNALETALSSTTISGYVDTSIQWNPGTGNAYVAPVSFQNPTKADGFNLNVVDLAIDKPQDDSPWAAGYHVELWMGPDANALATLSNPNLNPTAGAAGYLGYEYSNAGASDFAIRQAYVALRTPVGNGIDWKVGVFDSPLGYESTSSPSNPNYTHSYGYTIEPTELTGVLATYKVNDMISVSAGIADIISPMINGRAFINYDNEYSTYPTKAESYKTYIGSITLTAPQSWGWAAGSTLSGGVANGFSTAFNGADQTSWYLGGTMNTPVAGLKVGAALDYLNQVNNYQDFSYWTWTAALYANYQFSGDLSNLSLNVRGDYWDNYFSPYYGGTDKLWGFTADAQYNLWKNVISRVEFRWDHAEHSNPFGGTQQTYYSYDGYYYNYPDGVDPNKNNAFMFALQLIYQF